MSEGTIRATYTEFPDSGLIENREYRFDDVHGIPRHGVNREDKRRKAFVMVRIPRVMGLIDDAGN